MTGYRLTYLDTTSMSGNAFRVDD